MSGPAAPVPPIIDGFTFLRFLGAGGHADVFLYHEAAHDRDVAVKVLRDSTLSPRILEKFRAEAGTMAGLYHPAIVTVLNTGETRDHRPYIAMQPYANGSLERRVEGKGLAVAAAIRIGIEVGAAVETAHRVKGVLHRDIKPANILLDDFDSPGLTDFGIAGKVTDADDPDLGVSLPWSPPEAIFARTPTSVESDVYSLAATIWHLLVGRSPFEEPVGDNSTRALMTRIRDVPAPATGRPDVPASLDALLKRSMSKAPEQRPGSAYEFVLALREIEQELGFAPTEVKIAGGVQAKPALSTPSDAHRGAPPPNGTVRRPPVVSPDRPADAALAEPATAIVDGYRPERDDRTVVRAVDPTRAPRPTPELAPSVPGRPRPHRGVLLLAGIVVAVGLLAGVALSAAGREPKTTPSPTLSSLPPDLTDRVPPGLPRIAATRSSGVVAFTWTYASPLADDQVEWRIQGTTDVHLSGPGGSATVPATSPSPVCVEVRVSRFDGSYSQGNDWTPSCG